MQMIKNALVASALLMCPMTIWADETTHEAKAGIEREEPHASLTGNFALTSNYIFRGISQTFDKPAIQGGVDWVHPSGFYLGTWASTISSVSYNNTNLEWDVYGGYNGSISDDFAYNVALLGYLYPGGKYNAAPDEKYDTLEATVGVTYKFLNVKYSHTLTDYYGVNNNTVSVPNGDSQGSGYIEANVNYEVMDKLILGLHVGHQKIKNYGDLDYTDYKVSLSKQFGGVNLTAAYSDTNADPAIYTISDSTGKSKDISNGAFFVTAAMTFD